MKKERRNITFSLINKFEMEYEKLLNGISNFTTEEKLHITKTFLEIVNLRRKGEDEWRNITELYQKELREKYREKFAEGHRINLLAYFYDGAILDKSRGTGEFDFYTNEEFNNLESSEVQLLSESEIQGLLHFVGNYLTSKRDTFLDMPVAEEEEKESTEISNDKDYKKAIWFEVGLLFATGKIQELLAEHENNYTQIAKKLGNINFRPYISETNSNTNTDNNNKNIYSSKKKITLLHRYCTDSSLTMTDEFKAHFDRVQQEL